MVLFLKKAISKRYPAQTITETDNVDYLPLLVNAFTQAESLLYSLEHAAGGTGLQRW